MARCEHGYTLVGPCVYCAQSECSRLRTALAAKEEENAALNFQMAAVIQAISDDQDGCVVKLPGGTLYDAGKKIAEENAALRERVRVLEGIVCNKHDCPQRRGDGFRTA